ncbi:S-adenosylmethionine synthetase N-terminal domain-containing protein [Kocuria atrinae]|uniref:S-adenosylmethionine synthetase N-terminal domain-containing protein n=1 Tax=Kocuria atrinae TaxID=592377 RepID=UPI001CB8F190
MSVTEEHPGKICGHVSAGILEGLSEKNPSFSVTIDTMVAPGLVHATGKANSWKYVERPGTVR